MVLAAVYLINIKPLALLNNKTLHEILFDELPEFEELRIFGCLILFHDQRSKSSKFSSPSQRCIFIGYPNGKRG